MLGRALPFTKLFIYFPFDMQDPRSLGAVSTYWSGIPWRQRPVPGEGLCYGTAGEKHTTPFLCLHFGAAVRMEILVIPIAEQALLYGKGRKVVWGRNPQT
eukprot:scaffold228615_cov18-Tisochrysis_lutea.AAC.3